MASTYVNNLRLEEIGSGEQSGTWGDTTNTNLEIIGQAVAWGTRAVANASTDNITIADGALDADRCLGLKLTGGGQACTVTLLPNTSSKTWFMYNATAAALTFTCGSGANVVIPAGQTKVIATDGLGSGGVVHDLLTAVNLAGATVVDDLTVSDDLTVTGDIDVDGTTNLDVVDIDGAVNMATTALVTGVLTTTAATVFNGGFASNAASTISTADNTDTLQLISTDADANVGPNLRLYRNSSSPADNDTIGVIDFEGRNDNSQDIIAARINVLVDDVSDGTEDATLFINTMLAGAVSSRIKMTPTETIFNDDSKDLNFRVESNGNANMIFVDGGANHVNIGTATDLTGTLNVESAGIAGYFRTSATGPAMVIESTEAGAGYHPKLTLHKHSASPADNDFLGRTKYIGRNDNSQDVTAIDMLARMVDVSDGTEDFKLIIQGKKAGTDVNILQIGEDEVIINEDSNDIDFRVESNANSHMLFVDGGNNRVGIGTTPDLGAGLHIRTADSGASVSANADELIIEGSGNTGITIASGNDSGGNIFFADDGGVQQGKIQYDHDANAMLFRANNVDRVKIHSNGVAAFNNGIALGVGTANTASNVLDDYEEGTFTPVISFGGGTTGIQYDTQLGFYTKIGRKVMIQINVALTNKGSSTGNAVVAGFPFTSASTSVGVGAVSGYKVANTGHMSMRLNDNNTTGTFQQLNSSGVLATLQNSAFSNDSEFQVSGTFFTA
mgnify:CR=1 FL=1